MGCSGFKERDLKSATSAAIPTDLALVAHLSTLKARVPFINFFDGFRTSHEVAKIDVWDEADNYAEIRAICDEVGIAADVADFKSRSLKTSAWSPKILSECAAKARAETCITMGIAQNGDTYFQNRETANSYYAATPAIVQQMMDVVSAKCGRNYHLFDYVGAPDADKIIVCMGSGCEILVNTDCKVVFGFLSFQILINRQNHRRSKFFRAQAVWVAKPLKRASTSSTQPARNTDL